MPDAALRQAIRAVLAGTPSHGEGHRKIWARLRVAGVRTSKRRVLRLMRENDLLAPSRVGSPHGSRRHDGTIIPETVDTMWGTDLTMTITGQGLAAVFIAIDHCSAGCVGIHADRGSAPDAARVPRELQRHLADRTAWLHHASGLTGAANVVLPGMSHNGCIRGREAFREMWRFLTGHEPETLNVVPESSPVLDGMVTGRVDGLPTNLPVAGIMVEIFEVSPTTGERLGPALHRRTTSADGAWGPFAASPTAYYEFVVTAPGYPVQHIYRTPFPRSTAILHLRLRGFDAANKGTVGSVFVLDTRGDALYRDRDTVLIDDVVPPALKAGPNDENEVTMRIDTKQTRAAPVVLNKQQLTARTWLAQENHLVLAVFHYRVAD
jgi:hypothetical protein